MGGSRRKVTNSRKSTQKRHKQYFEQKKRQQHTNGLDDDAAEEISGDKSDCRKKATETRTISEFSLLDLLGEDGSNGKAEGSPVHECYVAFSVEGLGKTRIETPVHSPQQQCRLPSPPKAAKRHLSSNKYKMNELKQNAVLYDIDMPTSHSSFDLPFNSRDIRDNHGNTRSDYLFVKGCKPVDGLDFKLDSLFTEGCFDNNLEDKSESPLNGMWS